MIPYAMCLVGRTLTQPKIDSLRAGLSARGFEVGESVWLSPRYALDLYLEAPEGMDPGPVVQDVRRALPQVDAALVPMENRRKSLLVADMDSTLITSESLVEIAEAAGQGPAVANMTSQAMRGRVGFVESLMDRLKLVAGTPESLIQDLGAQAVLSPGAQVLCATMAAEGARLVMASGGFTQVAHKVAQRLGIHRTVANQLVVVDGALSGGVHLPIVDGAMKAEILREEADLGGLTPDQTLAVGDGANDLEMIQLAGLGVAYQGKPVLQAAAQAAINHSDLTSLLYFQGYCEDELIRP